MSLGNIGSLILKLRKKKCGALCLLVNKWQGVRRKGWQGDEKGIVEQGEAGCEEGRVSLVQKDIPCTEIYVSEGFV